MFQTYEQVRKFLDDQQIQMVDMKFTDLWGRWHHLTIPASQFEPDIMDKGIGFDGSAVGFKSVKAGDMVLVPDLKTSIHGSILGHTHPVFHLHHPRSGHACHFHNDPRNIAIRAEES